MSVKQVISKPLDHIEPFAKPLTSASIDVSAEQKPKEEQSVPGAPGFSGVKLVDATAQAVNTTNEQTIQTISDKELEAMSTQPQISDLSDFGDFNIAPTDSVVDILDATDFPTISNVEPIIDNVSIDTKEIKEAKK